MHDQYVIGIDAGGTKVAYGLFDTSGKLIDRARHSSDANADARAFADVMIENIQSILTKNDIPSEAFIGAGVCMPSYIIYDKGHILVTSALPKIKDFPMRDYLEERLNTRIVLDNDSNAAAIAEYRRGAGRGLRHMVYVTIGTGLGSGIIIDGRLFHGSYGSAGECGHMIATPGKGFQCGCENAGCYMSYSSGRFFPHHVKRLLDEGVKSELTLETADGFHIHKACEKGDALAERIIGQTAEYVGLCLFNVYQVLNIDTFVFGGGLTNFGPILFDRIRTVFDRYNHIALPVHFKMAELKENFGIIGAAEFIMEKSNG